MSCQRSQTRALESIARELEAQRDDQSWNSLSDFSDVIPKNPPYVPVLPWLRNLVAPAAPQPVPKPAEDHQLQAARAWMIGYLAQRMPTLNAADRRAACRIAFPRAVELGLVNSQQLPIFLNGCPSVEEERRDPKVFERYAAERRG
jgi:hypothetical protein